jgi:hypothetical protein
VRACIVRLDEVHEVRFVHEDLRLIGGGVAMLGVLIATNIVRTGLDVGDS